MKISPLAYAMSTAEESPEQVQLRLDKNARESQILLDKRLRNEEIERRKEYPGKPYCKDLYPDVRNDDSGKWCNKCGLSLRISIKGGI